MCKLKRKCVENPATYFELFFEKRPKNKKISDMKEIFDSEEIEILKLHKENKLKVSKSRKKEIENAVESAEFLIIFETELNIKL